MKHNLRINPIFFFFQFLLSLSLYFLFFLKTLLQLGFRLRQQ
jgi:hypothetical protein